MAQTKNNELFVRKRLATFVEKMCRYLGYDFRHELFKAIVYSETEWQTPLEEKLKNYYDAYCYLLSNHKNPFTSVILGKFLYLLTGQQADGCMLLRVVSLLFDLSNLPAIEQATTFHLQAFDLMPELDEETRFVVSVMLFNYVLTKNEIPSIRLKLGEWEKYGKLRKKYFNGDMSPLENFMLELVLSNKTQDKSYYKQLIPLTTQDVISTVLHDKEWLKEQYGIIHISIFGSFAKGNNRIDSDVDFLACFDQHLSFSQKQNNIELLSNYYFNLLHRFVDISEVGKYLNDEAIKENTKHIKIF